jgi:hypothetical protein
VEGEDYNKSTIFNFLPSLLSSLPKSSSVQKEISKKGLLKKYRKETSEPKKR